MSSFKAPANFSMVLAQPMFFENITLTKQADLIEGIPDGILALIAPIVAYWGYSMFFHIIDVYELAEKYRIHPSEEEQSRNKVTLHEVIRDVLFQHVIQTVVGLAVFYFDPTPQTGGELYAMWNLKHNYLPSFVPDWAIYYGYMYGFTVLKLAVAITIIDTWQFWLHRIMHVNKALYRRFHSRHHRLYVPYAFGALYNDPVEGFLLDTVGTGVASLTTGLTHRECIILYTFATMKTVDDHCGYRLPFDLFQLIFPNNSVYHDIHHQMWGIKSNFSQPFFTFWDVFSNTQYKFVNEYKELQNHITLTKYREFLAKKSKSTKKTKAEVDIEEEEKIINNETKKDI
ncbi:Sphingolipid C4-hydroxylase SUR2 [Candida viswanathii]|uniref:Sphingolipid C4-hydroxylase SUR2 n=1 Tax=Candida viswanathii TaxID=5486 RepID=A0A367XNE5_9ASCO|nr:Sphingolipid C4-hydroxylase SUR2 [Candida viswanathii]